MLAILFVRSGHMQPRHSARKNKREYAKKETYRRYERARVRSDRNRRRTRRGARTHSH